MSNLARSFNTTGANERNAKLGQIGSGRGHVTYFENLGPLHIAETVGARNVKFGTQIRHHGKCKISSNGVGKRSRDLLLKLWYPLHISETLGARNFKFGASKQNANVRDDQ